jgi:hypothetical protein
MSIDVLGIPDEGRDALMSAALDPPARALESWRQWERAGRDVGADPIALRWLPLIGRNLSGAPVDPGTRALFLDARRLAWISNLRLLDAARPVFEALAAAGIRTMLLKGAALVLTSCDAPGIRPIGDVDVLIEPEHARTAKRIVEQLGWVAWRGYSERDFQLAHGLNLQKPPHGALDLHWYLLTECCWPGADRGLWPRAQPLASISPMTVVPSPADLLLHVCLHGLRWSPVHAGHWVSDAVCILQAAGDELDWQVVIDECARRRLGLQMMHALRVVDDRGHVDIPEAVIGALERQPDSWCDRLECRLKGRPVVSAGGLFVIWAGWRRTVRAAGADGLRPPSWLRYLAAALGLTSPARLAGRFATHAWTRAKAVRRRQRSTLRSDVHVARTSSSNRA